MELIDFKDVELQYLDVWMANLVDNINYDLGQIQIEVPTLDMKLNTIDTAPVEYLAESLNNLVDDLNENMEMIADAVRSIESRLTALEAGKGDKNVMDIKYAR